MKSRVKRNKKLHGFRSLNSPHLHKLFTKRMKYCELSDRVERIPKKC